MINKKILLFICMFILCSFTVYGNHLSFEYTFDSTDNITLSAGTSVSNGILSQTGNHFSTQGIGRIIHDWNDQISGTRENFTVNFQTRGTAFADGAIGMILSNTNASTLTPFDNYMVEFRSDVLDFTLTFEGIDSNLHVGGFEWSNISVFLNWSANGDQVMNIFDNGTFITNHSLDPGEAIERIMFTSQAGGDYDLDNVTVCNSTGPDFGCVAHIVVAPVSDPNITLKAEDLADSTTISNFSVIIDGQGELFDQTTGNGTILIVNVTENLLYNVTFTSNQSGGYFNRTFELNFTQQTFTAELFQSVLKVQALDTINDNSTILEFNTTTNLTVIGTKTGELLILIKKGTFQLNVSAVGFETVVTNFSIIALANDSLNVSMGSIFTFFLIREETNVPFDFNGTNETKVIVFCPNQTIEIFFNTSSNVSQIINCNFNLMQIVVDYGVLGSYFRTLIPNFADKNITWYLIDLNAGDTAIQKILELLDLTGDFSNSILTAKRAVGGVIRTIIEQRFDISNQVNLFLVKDGLYTISINNLKQDIVLGNLIPTEAGTQTITLPKLDFSPGDVIIGENVTFAYTFNSSQGIIRMQYVDQVNKTISVTFTVFNGSNPSQQLFIGQSQGNATVTITFNQVVPNETYITELFVLHSDITNFTDKKVFYDLVAGAAGAIDLVGWTANEQVIIKKWTAFIWIGLWGLLFSKIHAGIGIGSLIFWVWIFKVFNWIQVNNLIFGLLTIMAATAWIAELIRRE